jgi:hypothetical protein
MTACCRDKPAYLAPRREPGALGRRRMGTHYPAVSMIFVSDLLDSPGKIALEATAVPPAWSTAAGLVCVTPGCPAPAAGR